ncbi:MAG TPA: glutaredoxin family protein [Thermoleophilaceae bacterium]|nr:glutaredoxin family protein [Thermoleophilaceae bacterium]
MPLVTLYGKPGCHLCEEARTVVEAVRADRGFELREIDVSLDPVLHRRYGERIPVVAVDGTEAFEYFVDPAALHEALDEARDSPR